MFTQITGGKIQWILWKANGARWASVDAIN